MPADNHPTEIEREEALKHTRYPVDPAALGQPDGRHIRVDHSPADVSSSYATQRYFFDAGAGQRMQLLEPSNDALRQSTESPEVHFLTAWNRGGERSTFRENDFRQQQLRRELGDLVGRVVVAVPPNHRWFEPALMTRGLSDGDAVSVARRYLQPAVVAWRNGDLCVLPVGPESVVTAHQTCASLRVVPRTCPIRDDLDPSGRCTSRGGPWVSASIHAHALWSSHRSLGVRLLGCGPCVDGRLPCWSDVGGRTIKLSDECLGSRYGGASWRL